MPNLSDITSRDDLAAYLTQLAEQIRNGDYPVENDSTPDLIEAAGAWIHDMDGYYLNHGETPPQTPTWQTIAHIITAALVYE